MEETLLLIGATPDVDGDDDDQKRSRSKLNVDRAKVLLMAP